MLVKKYKKARLSSYSRLFFQLGLALSLLIIYVAMEWKTPERHVQDIAYSNIQPEEILDIPVTQRIIETKPLPPPPPAPEKIEIVNDNSDIIENVLESTETDQSEAIQVNDNQAIDKIEEVVEEEEVEEDVPFAIIEEVPTFPGCKGNNKEKKKCFEEKIKQLVAKNYNTGLAAELGLPPGKKKVYVQFRVDKDGNIVDIRARGPHKRLEKEAIRVVQKLPKMIPGRQRGRPVGVKYTLPITLIVEDAG